MLRLLHVLVTEIREYACQRKRRFKCKNWRKKNCCMYEKSDVHESLWSNSNNFFTWALRSCLTVSCTKTSAKVLKSWTNLRFFWSPAFSWTSNSSNADSARITREILAPFSEAFTSAWSKLRAGTFIFSKVTFLVPSCSLHEIWIFFLERQEQNRRLYCIVLDYWFYIAT